MDKKDYSHLLSQVGVRNVPFHKSNSGIRHRKSNSQLPPPKVVNNGNILKGNKNTVRGLIDQMYQREKKYIKQYYKEDYIQNNDFIFNLNKTHQLRLAKTNKHESHDYSLPPSSYKSSGEARNSSYIQETGKLICL